MRFILYLYFDIMAKMVDYYLVSIYHDGILSRIQILASVQFTSIVSQCYSAINFPAEKSNHPIR